MISHTALQWQGQNINQTMNSQNILISGPYSELCGLHCGGWVRIDDIKRHPSVPSSLEIFTSS